MIHETGTRISAVAPYDGVVGQSAGGRLKRVRAVVRRASAGALRIKARHRVHALVPPVSGVVIAAGLGPTMTETAGAFIPLVATLRSFVAEGTGYTLGALVTGLGALVPHETTPGLGALVREHAGARAVSLVPAGGRHFSVIYVLPFP